MARDYAIWWTSQEDCEQLTDTPNWSATTPPYLQQQYQARWGRAGNGRLWGRKDMPDHVLVPYPSKTLTGTTYRIFDDWPLEYPAARAAKHCGGIVLYASDVGHVATLPGFVTTLDLRWFNGQAA